MRLAHYFEATDIDYSILLLPEDECEYISSQMMTVPEFDFEKIDNFVYDELEILRLK